MNNLVRKKIILCLLDSEPKSADTIANELDQSLATVEDQLIGLVSDSICEEIRQDEACQYAIKKDVDAFTQLVKEFLLDPAEHEQEIEQFITSEHYHTRIDYELVDYALSRFHLESVYETDEAKEVFCRILLVSPSALMFALHGETAFFLGMWSSRNQFDFSEAARDWFDGILQSQFYTLLSQRLIADMEIPTYCILHNRFQILEAKTTIQVALATPHGKYVEVMGARIFGLGRVMEALHAGQPVSTVNPIHFSNSGLALLHLGEFETALENFDKAFNALEDPIQKAFILNNKGVVFLRIKQYQKAILCFDEGIVLDSEDEIPLLRTNKQTAEEYLAIATDADNLTGPTQIRFVQGAPVPFEETLFYEFKEIGSGNPASRIGEIVDEYAVGFLNCEGGRIFWGIRDKDRITVGVRLNHRVRNEIRENVPNKLNSIQPSISPEHCKLEFHEVYDLQGETAEDLWVIELVVPPPQERDVFYTSSPKLYVRDDGVTRELKGPAATEFILRRMQSDTETN